MAFPRDERGNIEVGKKIDRNIPDMTVGSHLPRGCTTMADGHCLPVAIDETQVLFLLGEREQLRGRIVTDRAASRFDS